MSSIRYSFALMVLALATVLCVSSVDAQTRGYVARACGFDLDGDGIRGEPSDDCRICDGVTTDPDGDGKNEDLIYVDCSSGSDSGGCGAPGSPCRSVDFAVGSIADGPGDGAEDIICFRGTCTAHDITPKSGVAGHYTVAASGNQVRAFEYPQDPFMVVGWDFDRDGAYPPFDSDDTAVLDGLGGTNGPARAFSHNGVPSYIEYAHFSAKDYGRGNFSKQDVGFIDMGSNGGSGDSTHVYFHDLELSGILQDHGARSNSQVFKHFKGTARSLQWIAKENLECRECGGYVERGTGGPRINEVSGPFRMQNFSYTAHGCDSSGSGSCVTSEGTDDAFVTISKLWGMIDGIEILDCVFDANVAAWKPAYNVIPVQAIIPNCATHDWDIINNVFINFRKDIELQPDDGGFCGGTRRMDDIRIERNWFLHPAGDAVYKQVLPIGIEAGGGAATETVENVTIANNVIYGGSAGYKFCIESNAGFRSSCGGNPHTGQIRIVGNTCYGALDSGPGAISIWGKATPACRHQDYTVTNNIIAGLSGGKNIAVGGIPSGFRWQAASNVFDSSGSYEWNNATKSSLSAFRSASGGDSSSNECSPSFEDVAAADLHLVSSDACARNRGTNVAAISPFDIDGGTRPQGGGWDVGADEVGAAGSGGAAPPPTGGGNNPPTIAAPVLREAQPIGN